MSNNIGQIFIGYNLHMPGLNTNKLFSYQYSQDIDHMDQLFWLYDYEPR